jgi:hypothetical protein
MRPTVQTDKRSLLTIFRMVVSTSTERAYNFVFVKPMLLEKAPNRKKERILKSSVAMAVLEVVVCFYH